MKTPRNHNRGATLIELIASVAVLSIIGICCYTLLMFSIRTNNIILTGTSAYRDAELLNDRLEYLFNNSSVLVKTTEENDTSDESDAESENDVVTLVLEDESTIVLTCIGSSLWQGETELQDRITFFSADVIEEAGLIRIRYTIGESCEVDKVFSCSIVVDENSSSQKGL